MIKRREFIAGLGGAAAWPGAARAQQAAVPGGGFLARGGPDLDTPLVLAFHQGLTESGHIEGRNVAVEYRWAEGQVERLPALAADLVRRQVTVIAATGGVGSALAAQSATL